MSQLTKTDQNISDMMQKRGLGPAIIDLFLRQKAENIDNTASNKAVDWSVISPFTQNDLFHIPEELSQLKKLEEIGNTNLGKCVIIKLNGGRSTTMGGAVPKCTIEAKNGKSFLDIAMQRIMELNDTFDIEIPLLLMNSFFTDQVTEQIVGRTPLIIINFIQNEYPRLLSSTLEPLSTETDADWCPPGHGDFYRSFYDSGTVDNMLSLGYRWAFVSNIDNEGADVSPLILGMIVDNDIDFLLEVTRKTPADVKGGAPVFIDGQPNLLEIAQVPSRHVDDFQDINRFQYFNTNNIWIDLEALKKKMLRNEIDLPVILNHKNIEQTDVIQIETAMGAAMGCFDRAAAVEVPRSRFFPIKKMSDLLVLQSDTFILNDQFQILINPERSLDLPERPLVNFVDGFMASNNFDDHFVDFRTLSLKEAQSLIIGGNVFFEKNVTIRGNVEIINTASEPKIISAGTVLHG